MRWEKAKEGWWGKLGLWRAPGSKTAASEWSVTESAYGGVGRWKMEFGCRSSVVAGLIQAAMGYGSIGT